METRKMVLPAMAFVGGALLGRFFGVKGLVRGAMAALTLLNVSEGARLLEKSRAPRRKAVAKTARKRLTKKRAVPRKASATVPASAQTH